MSEEPLERARRLAREHPPQDWPSVSADVARKVRRRALPGRSFRVESDGGVRGDSMVKVNSRVVVALVGEALTDARRAPARIELVPGEEEGLSRVEIDLVCAYGLAITEVLSQARDETREVLGDTLGAVGQEVEVEVRAVDVIDGDPRLV